jgi:hypothetical protein
LWTRYCDEGSGCRPSAAGRLTTTYNESVSGVTLNAKITPFFTTSLLLKSDVPGHYLETTFQIQSTNFEVTLRHLFSMFKDTIKQPSEFRHLGEAEMYCYDPQLKTWWFDEHTNTYFINILIQKHSSNWPYGLEVS